MPYLYLFITKLTYFVRYSIMVFFLAKHPEVQEKLREEVLLHLPTENDRLKLNALEKMPYMAGVIKEGLRLHPPAIGTVRQIDGPVEIGDYRIEKTALYFAVNSVMQTSSRYVKVNIYVILIQII